jgi:hypothetical protein
LNHLAISGVVVDDDFARSAARNAGFETDAIMQLLFAVKVFGLIGQLLPCE